MYMYTILLNIIGARRQKKLRINLARLKNFNLNLILTYNMYCIYIL